MTVNWQNGADHAVVDVRPGGPGNSWQIIDLHGMIDGTSGGGRARETLWGRTQRGGLAPRGLINTSNPNDWTGTFSYPLTAQNFLRDVLFRCPFDIRAREYCERPDNITDYNLPGIIGYLQATNTDFSYDNPLAMGDGVEADVKKQVAFAASFEQMYAVLAHDDISAQWSDADYNRVINIGVFKCEGPCGAGSSEEDEFLAVSDQDSTPGYSGNATARLYYTRNSGTNVSSVPIDLFQGADAVDVVFLGDRIVVFSPDKPPAYASYTDILNGVTAPNLWTTSGGFSAISSPNYPIAAVALDSARIVAVGAGGRVWMSSDGGISFTLISNGTVTASNLTAIDGQGNMVYIGGASGTFLRATASTNTLQGLTLITVTDGTTTLSDNINVVRTPPDRSSEAHLGTAGGQIWYSENADATVPVFTIATFDKSGNGLIKDLAFAGYRGDQVFFIQTNADGLSRIMRDWSGGAYGSNVEVVGASSFVSPPNFGFNSIAPANVNYALVVGNIHNTYGFLGRVRPQLP